MYRGLLLLLLAYAGAASGAESVQQRMRQIDSALGRISAEQQSVYQQFNMVQEVRRNEERQMLAPAPQAYMPSSSPPNYDDIRRAEEARVQRLRDMQYELDRLYARYRELEQQKKPLLDALSALAQQRGAEEAAAR